MCSPAPRDWARSSGDWRARWARGTALRFHRATLLALLRGLTADRRFRIVLAVTPGRSPCSRSRSAVPRLDQGRGDLGRRMDRALRRFRFGRAAIIGTDIPEAGPADLRGGVPRARGRRRRVRAGHGWRLLDRRGRHPAPGAPVPPGPLVHPTRTGRHAAEFPRSPGRLSCECCRMWTPPRICGRCRRIVGIRLPLTV